MKNLDLRSFLVGLSCAAFLALGLAAAPTGAPAPAPGPRFQITAMGDNILVLDHQTNAVSLLYKKRVNGKTAPEWPWVSDNWFSLGDAIEKRGGAEIKPGAGR
jgi:hypothetical protein